MFVVISMACMAHTTMYYLILGTVYTPRLSKWTFLDKNDCPDVHFVRLSAFIVRTASSTRFYPMDAILPVCESSKTLSAWMHKCVHMDTGLVRAKVEKNKIK
jgi:hypothetical protein